MFTLLINLFKQNFAHRLAFKGGTFAYFFYDLDRFSTDIDLDVMDGNLDAELLESFTNFLCSQGEVKVEYENPIGYRYRLSYDNDSLPIKIDLNARIWKSNKYEIVNMRGISLYAMDKGSIFGNKLFAASQRIAARDLRDIHFFFRKVFPINKEVIEERIDVYEYQKEHNVNTYTDYIKYLASFIAKNITSKHIVDANLGVVLTDEQKHRARKYLKEEIIQYLSLEI
jgi:predicted nucleotidyltransferase component of viral defense system